MSDEQVWTAERYLERIQDMIGRQFTIPEARMVRDAWNAGHRSRNQAEIERLRERDTLLVDTLKTIAFSPVETPDGYRNLCEAARCALSEVGVEFSVYLAPPTGSTGGDALTK